MLYVCKTEVAEDELLHIVGYVFVDMDDGRRNAMLMRGWWGKCMIDISEMDACALKLKGYILHAVTGVVDHKSIVSSGFTEDYMGQNVIMVNDDLFEWWSWR